MKRGRKKAKGRATPPPPPPPGDEQLLIETFCASVDYVDIPFESWEHLQEDLNLRVPLWLPTADAQAGGERQVSFCRSTRDQPSDKPLRESVSCLVTIPPKTPDGYSLTVKGQGDVLATRTGDLIVTVHLKR